jgi:hypothetical protein
VARAMSSGPPSAISLKQDARTPLGTNA